MRYEHIVETKDLARYYKLGGSTIKALDGIDLKVKPHEYLSIVGPSGSGKTTLFNMIGGLDRPTRGKVYIDDVDIATLDAYGLASLRCRKIGYIFQTFNLIQISTALENVAMPMIFAGIAKESRMERATELLRSVGLGDRLNHKPTELSAGQQQRVALARAIANDPVLVLADEPTGNLDLQTGHEIINLLKRLSDEHNVTIIAATHDRKMIDMSDRIIWVRDGKIETEGKPDDIE